MGQPSEAAVESVPLRVDIDFDGDAEVLGRALSGDPAGWLPALHFAHGPNRWQLYLWVGGLGALVDCTIGSPRQADDGVARAMRWDPGDPNRTSPLGLSAPAFDGELRLEALGAGHLRLLVEGRYESPAAAGGLSLDRVNYPRLAEATAREFLIDIHGRLASRHPEATGQPGRSSAEQSSQAPATVDSQGLEILGVETCLQLLETQTLGRVAVVVDRKPLVLPVNYAMHRGTVVFRTDPGTKLDAALGEEFVAFEVDDIDEDDWSGWSVLVVGQAERVYQPEELEELRELPLRPWVQGDRAHWIRVLSTAISGRRIVKS
jgi:nitroimidazol reductase NimA-like FMN-containing flavoprotein (pyridoxamine 5'-phosphate oxidase superfamily)